MQIRPCVAVLIASVLFAAQVRAEEAPPKAVEGKLLTGGGFVLHQPKWKKKGSASINTGLVVRYKWGGKGERAAAIGDGGSEWVMTFADSPSADEVATLILEFHFNLLEKDKKNAVDIAQNGIDAAVNLVSKALEDAGAAHLGDPDKVISDAAARVKAGSGIVVEALKPLRELRTNDGKSGDALVLEALGFKQETDGSWALPSLALDKLREFVKVRMDVGLDARRDAAEKAKDALKLLSSSQENAPSSSAGCSDSVKSSFDEKGNDVDGLKKCWAMVNEYWTAQNAPRSAAAAADPAVLSSLREIKQSLVAIAPHMNSVTDADFAIRYGEIPSVVQIEIDKLIKNQVASGSKSYSIAAFDHFRRRIMFRNAEKAYVAKTTTVTDALSTRIDTMNQQQLGQALLEVGAEKRRFQVATGVVYVHGLDQVVMPVIVSYCVFDGCIGKGKTILEGESWKHMFSVDLGVRGSTLNRTDPRDSKDVSFLVGVSVDPLWCIRVSGGAYVFFNGQSHSWNSTWYGGVTFDLIHAAALLGVTGLGVPQVPEVKSTSSLSNKGVN